MPKCPEGKLIDQTGKEWACEKKCLGGECATVTGEEAMAVVQSEDTTTNLDIENSRREKIIIK